MSGTISKRKNVVLFGLPILIGAVILHTYQLVMELRLMREAFPFEANLFPARLQIILTLSLLFAAAGLAIGRRWGLMTSTLGLGGVLLSHVYWFYHSHRSFQILAQDPFSAKHPEFKPTSLFGLIGANWWDILLLILFAALLVWEISALLKGVENQHRNTP